MFDWINERVDTFYLYYYTVSKKEYYITVLFYCTHVNKNNKK